jgi:TetR/AcrR family transcriptional repressor of bet genes
MPKRVDITAQRRTIADAAITVINQTGLDRTRLRDVARAGNVTTGAVTHYFDGKDAVLEAALEEIVRRTLERIDRSGDADTSGDVAAFIGRVCRYLPIDDVSRREWRVWLAFWGRAIADERLRAVHRSYYGAFVDRLIRYLRPLGNTGSKTSAKKLRRYADALIAAIDGVGTRATLEPGDWPPKRQRETLSSLLMPMLTELSNGTDTA